MIPSDVMPISPVYASESSSGGEQAIGASGTGDGGDPSSAEGEFVEGPEVEEAQQQAPMLTYVAIAIRAHGLSDYSPPLSLLVRQVCCSIRSRAIASVGSPGRARVPAHLFRLFVFIPQKV